MSLFSQFITDFCHLLFPDRCNACDRQLVRGEKQLCTKCMYDLPYTDFHLYAANAVARLFWGRINCNAAMALLYFRKGTRVQHLIHRLKYQSQTTLGISLGMILGERLAQSPAYSGAGLLIPVPLHPKRERSRGYNQSQCIAEGIARILQVPVSTTQLIRQKPTDTQTRKNRYKRFENMRSVFHIPDPASLAGRHIILVDDVITTGATLEACGQVLLDCGVSKLSIAALAYAE